MKRNRLFILVVICFLENTQAEAQPRLWEVYTISNQPFVGVIIDGYRSDSLYVKSMNQVIVLHQDSIRYLVQRNSSKFAVGFIFGAFAGAVLASESVKGSDGAFSGLGRLTMVPLGIVLGGAIGGSIGSAAGADKRYQIDKLDIDQKRKLLTNLFPNG